MIEVNGTFFIQIVNFFLIILFLNHFLFKPVLAIVDKRNGHMRSLEDEASQSRALAEKGVADSNEKIAEMRKTMAAILLSARQQAAEDHERMVTGTQENNAKVFETAIAQMEEQVQKARTGLRGDAEKFSRLMAVRILGRDVR